MYRGRILAGALAAVIAGGVAYTVHARGGTELDMELTASSVQTDGGDRYTFTISGTPVDGLYPGAVRHIRLTFTNPYAFDLNVTSMRPELVAASKTGCEPIASNLEIQPYTGALPVRVPAEDSRQNGNIPLRMPNSVDNACQQAIFTIRLSGDAVRADA